MLSKQNVISILLFLISAFITDFVCATTSPPKPFPPLENQQSSTTPWPALGQKSNRNVPQFNNNPQPTWVRPNLPISQISQSNKLLQNLRDDASNIPKPVPQNPTNIHTANALNSKGPAAPNSTPINSNLNQNSNLLNRNSNPMNSNSNPVNHNSNPINTKQQMNNPQNPFPPLPSPRPTSTNLQDKNKDINNHQIPQNPVGPPTTSKPNAWKVPPGNQSVSLGDIFKIPSYNPGWNSPSSTTLKPLTSTQRQRVPVAASSADQREDEELKEFTESLLKKDVNNAAKFVSVNYQKKTSSGSKTDQAPEPLLKIKPDAYSIPTINKLIQFYNNYILETTENEYVTPQEKAEENSFVDELMSTQIMQLTRNFLIKKGKISKDPKDFRDLLKQIWFTMYSRGAGKISSSGFEHVFLAEIKNNDVSGLHNWVYFSDQETKNKANYLGWLNKIDFGDKGAIVKYHFTFSNLDKPVGSMFIGTSPELEIALYSTCFLMRPDKSCPVKLGGKEFTIKTYTYRYRGKNMIGSAFPEI